MTHLRRTLHFVAYFVTIFSIVSVAEMKNVTLKVRKMGAVVYDHC